MYHSIIIGEKNTYDDWHLVPSSRPVVNPPEPKYSFVDIPGGNGSIDLTEANGMDLVYANREGSWEFLVENDHESWDLIYYNIINYCHGKYFDFIQLEDERSYIYKGRVRLNQWRSDPNWSKVTLDYILDPYKYEIQSAGEDWLWDPFDFETGIIDDTDISVNGTKTYTINVRSMPIVPTFYALNSGMSVIFKNETYALPINKDQKFYDIYLKSGANTLTLKGTGKIRIKFRNGVL